MDRNFGIIVRFLYIGPLVNLLHYPVLRAVDKQTHVGFRSHVKIASRIASYSSVLFLDLFRKRTIDYTFLWTRCFSDCLSTISRHCMKPKALVTGLILSCQLPDSRGEEHCCLCAGSCIVVHREAEKRNQFPFVCIFSILDRNWWIFSHV